MTGARKASVSTPGLGSRCCTSTFVSDPRRRSRTFATQFGGDGDPDVNSARNSVCRQDAGLPLSDPEAPVSPRRWGGNEDERLSALNRYSVLDTGRERAFDDLADLAADLLDAPIAVINFIAADRQWFKAEKGIGTDTLPLDVSICRHAILQPGVFVVPDLSKDARFEHNPLVKVAEGLRFYAGALLETPDGLPLGTVCVLDTKPRPEGITPRQARALTALAAQTMAQLELRRSDATARERSENLSAMFSQATVGMSEIGLDGRLLTVNDKLCEMLARSREDLLTLSMADITHPGDLAENLPKFARMAELGESFSLDKRYLRPDGTTFWANSSVTRLLDGQSRPRAALAVTADINARKDKERRRLLLLDLGDALQPPADAASIQADACRLLGGHLGIAQAGFAQFDTDKDHVFGHSEWNDGRLSSESGGRRIDVFGAAFLDDLKRGETIAIADVVIDPRMSAPATAEYTRIGVRAAINVPLVRDGELVTVLYLHHPEPRSWTSDEVALVEETFARVHLALDRARTEDALKESEERLRLAVDNADIGFWDVDLVNDAMIWPARTKAMFGISPDVQVTLADFYAGLHPDDRHQITEAFAAAADPARRAFYDVEYRTVGKEDGVERWVAAKGRGLFDRDGCCVRVAGTAIEITSRKAAEAALAESEERARLAVEGAKLGAWDWDLESSSGWWSPRTAEIMGVDSGEGVTPQCRARLIHPDDREAVAGALTAAVADGNETALDYRIVRPNGQVRWLISRGRIARRSDGQAFRITGIVQDVTDERVASEQLRESDQRFRVIADSAPLPMWVTQVDRTREFVNRAYVEFLGKSYEEATCFDWRTLIHPDDLERVQKEQIENEAALRPFTLEARYRNAIGEYRWLRSESQPRISASGVHAGFIGVAYDITIAKEAELGLRKLVDARTAELERVWRLSQDLLAVVEPDGKLLAVNSAWTVALGWDADELVGKTFMELAHPDDIGPTLEVFAAVFETPLVTPYTYRLRHKSGHYRWIAWTAAHEVGRVFASGRDISAEREREAELADAQEQLRQAQKMEAVGQLTGGLAHDFNNLLTGIMGNLELLQHRVARGRIEDLDRFVTAAQGAGRRAASLTQRLLAFSRRQTLDPKPTDVNRLIVGMEELLRRTVGPTADIHVVGAAGLWTAIIDSGQLENALLNLCINARDAMPDGGRITIETANKWLDDRTARQRDLPPGQYLSICVTDTGTGMTPEVIDRAFEPFYTTKPLGQGTGLGLSMIYGFARQSGGQVRIYSELGQGTTVCVYLPRFIGEAPTEELTAKIEESASGKGKTILVVDDEATIRHLIDEVLDDLEYTVIGAADGVAGLKVLNSGARIDLLITDVGLPNGMNGRQVADAARSVKPGLKVLFITGYAENAAVGNGHLEPGMELLTKPFALDDLTRKVREMLGSSISQHPG